jgi:hypothetical protein
MQAGRDIIDAWFILNNAYPLDEAMLVDNFGGRTQFFSTLLNVIQEADSEKILRDTGKLLSVDHRSWIKTSFLSDFQRLVSRNLEEPF